MSTHTIFVYDLMDFVLFDLSSTFSYVFGWELECEYIDTLMYASMLVGVSIYVDQVYQECLVMFVRFMTLPYLEIL